MDIKSLPDELRNSAVPLTNIGINSHAWIYHDTLRLIEYCRYNHLVILGGDVLEAIENQEQIIFTHDNWFFVEVPDSDLSKIANDSCSFAKEKVEFYERSLSGRSLLFDLVVRQK